MSAPSLARRADRRTTSVDRPTTVPDTSGTAAPVGTGASPEPAVLVVSVRADAKGARAAAQWAGRVAGDAAEHLVSTDPTLETRVDGARRVLVLDPGVLAALRGFGARARGAERMRLLARLAGRCRHVTWVGTEAEATYWIGRPG